MMYIIEKVHGGRKMVVVENLSGSNSLGNIKYVYDYRMMRSNLKLTYNNEILEVQSYGIEIERQDVINDRVIGIERDSVINISPDRHKIHNLLKLLHGNTVSPIHLVDVIGSFVDEYISDYDMLIKETAMV